MATTRWRYVQIAPFLFWLLFESNLHFLFRMFLPIMHFDCKVVVCQYKLQNLINKWVIINFILILFVLFIGIIFKDIGN